MLDYHDQFADGPHLKKDLIFDDQHLAFSASNIECNLGETTGQTPKAAQVSIILNELALGRSTVNKLHFAWKGDGTRCRGDQDWATAQEKRPAPEN